MAIIFLTTTWLMTAKNIKDNFSVANHNVTNIIKENKHPEISLFHTNNTYAKIYQTISANDGNQFHQTINDYLEKNNYKKILNIPLMSSKSIHFDDLKREFLFDVLQDVTILQTQDDFKNIKIEISQHFYAKINIYEMFYQQSTNGIKPNITENLILWAYRHSWKFQKKCLWKSKKYAIPTKTIIVNILQQYKTLNYRKLFIDFSKTIDNYININENNKYKTGIIIINLFSQYALNAAKLIGNDNLYNAWGYSNFFNNEFNWYKLKVIIYNLDWNNITYTRPTWPLVFPMTIMFILPTLGLYYFLQSFKYK